MEWKCIAIFSVVALSTIRIYAYDFEYNGLFYNVIDDEKQHVEVTYGDGVLNSYQNISLIIPYEISRDNNVFKVVQIGDKAFMGCERLETVVISHGVLRIGNSSFASCKNLKNVDLPNSISSIDVFAFAICEGLRSIVLPVSLKRIPEAIFAGCINLQTISIPDGVIEIGQKAFFQCENLESFVIPQSVVNLDGCAIFYGCKNLKSLEACHRLPISVHKLFTADIDPAKCKLIVPKGTARKYRRAKKWKNFTTIIENEDGSSSFNN